MRITDIKIGKILIPLKKPFKTSLRTVNRIENIVVQILTDSGTWVMAVGLLPMKLPETPLNP